MKRERVRLRRRDTRVRLNWRPEWHSGIYRWAFNYIQKNKWRCDPILEMEDLMQDAFLVFQRVADSYPRVVDPPHFMALYKRALTNEICDKSRSYTKQRGAIQHTNVDPMSIAENMHCNLADDGRMTALLATAPAEAQLLLSAFSDDSLLTEMRKPLRTRRGQPRKSFNARIKELIGIDNRVDLVGPVREWLTA